MKLVGRVPTQRLVGWAVFVLSFVVFLASPVRGLSDSRYSLVVSESLLRRGTFTLDAVFAAPAARSPHTGAIRSALSLQLTYAGGHVYYWYPPGTSLLSLPFVVALNALGLSVTDSQGMYAEADEDAMQFLIACLLMASFAAISYASALQILPPSWSAMIALGAALGTQVWSTASRTLWSHTWEVFLLGVVVYLLVRRETGSGRLGPVTLATLAAWLFFVRPTGALPVLGLTAYVAWSEDSRFWLRYLTTGLAWLGAFVAYSWLHFGTLFPSYFGLAQDLNFNVWLGGLAGTLLSPSRGLLVYVPAFAFVGCLLIRYCKLLPMRPLVWLSLAMITGHVAMVSAWRSWWGGYCYGARLTTCLVPWFVVLGIAGAAARKAARVGGMRIRLRRLEGVVGGLLLFVSLVANGIGAISDKALLWNTQPFSVDERPSRLWEWDHAQFLSAWTWPLPYDFRP
jgi:hypothetical protein